MIVVVDYGVGNLRSIHNILLRAGVEALVSRDPQVVRAATRLILPGVGHFGFAMQSLDDLGLIELLNERVREAGVPILGICLGAQLLGRTSEESGRKGLEWVPMETVRFDAVRLAKGDKVPHMGWAATQHTDSPLFAGMEELPRFYYAHSFHFQCDDPSIVTCTAEHGYRFASGIAYDNIFGVQFHPEKSHAYGRQLLRNFASMDVSS